MLPEVAFRGLRAPPVLTAAALRTWLGDAAEGAALFPTMGGRFLGEPALAARRGGQDWTAAFSGVSPHARPQGLRIAASDPVA